MWCLWDIACAKHTDLFPRLTNWVKVSLARHEHRRICFVNYTACSHICYSLPPVCLFTKLSAQAIMLLKNTAKYKCSMTKLTWSSFIAQTGKTEKKKAHYTEQADLTQHSKRVLFCLFDHLFYMFDSVVHQMWEEVRRGINTFRHHCFQTFEFLRLTSPSSSSTSRKSKSLKTLNCCSEVVSSMLSGSRVPSSEDTRLGWCSMRSSSPQLENITYAEK